jgi:hypothetical protein
VSELDLHRSAAGGEGLLDLAEGGRTRHAAEAKPRDLVERRTLFREARHAAAYRDDKACLTCPGAGGPAGLSDELRLCSLNALSQSSTAEQRRSAGIHGQSLAAIFRAVRASSG